MSRSVEISCDAHGCHQSTKEGNNWWIIRTDSLAFTVIPMDYADKRDSDLHICSFKCMHIMLDDYMQAHVNANKFPFEGVTPEIINIKQE